LNIIERRRWIRPYLGYYLEVGSIVAGVSTLHA
jgi:hypothetical protein